VDWLLATTFFPGPALTDVGAGMRPRHLATGGGYLYVTSNVYYDQAFLKKMSATSTYHFSTNDVAFNSGMGVI
jgi:hypothetical protein